MSFDTALALVLAVTVFVLACTMANLLARIARLESFARTVVGMGAPAAVPAAPVPLPDELRLLTKGGERARLAFVSADCPACEEAVAQIARWPEDIRRATYLVYRDEPPAGFVTPAGVRLVPDGGRLFESLSIRGTPTFLHVEDGMIAGRSTGPLPTRAPAPPPDDLPTPHERRSA
jgi:hypothetical protein